MSNEKPSNPASESRVISQFPSQSIGLTIAACVGGFLIPGLGHILMGRWIRGLMLTLAIGLMFLIGISMEGELYRSDLNQPPLRLFGFFADAGVGVMYWLADYKNLGLGKMSARNYDYGTTYLWVCGLLNYLTILDVFDIARGRKP